MTERLSLSHYMKYKIQVFGLLMRLLKPHDYFKISTGNFNLTDVILFLDYITRIKNRARCKLWAIIHQWSRESVDPESRSRLEAEGEPVMVKGVRFCYVFLLQNIGFS